MANKLYEETNISAIADAIRAKGVSGTMTVAQMSAKVAAIPTKETVTWHQCPEAVRNYLANVTYDPSDYTTSQIASYAPATAVMSNTKPIGKTVDGVTYYNEVPNVTTPFSSTNTAGTLKPLDTLRWIRSDCIEDFRDLGGWTCDGGKVKYGRLFRGSRLVSTSASGIQYLVNDLGIKAELDLRYDEDIATNPETLKDYILYEHIDGAWYTISETKKWKSHIQFVFDNVAHNRPVWYHCAGGLDRTGTLSCIIEGLLGMSQSDIDKDYELGSFYSGTANDSVARRRNESDWRGLITEIASQSGSTFRDKCVNFVASLGFTAAEINAFRVSMIDGNPSAVTPSITNYTVTANLTLTDIDNSSQSIQKGKTYTAKLTAQDGTLLKSASVIMGGVTISDSVYKTIIPGGIDLTLPHYGEINIPLVTGNLVINALSESNARLPSAYQEVQWIGVDHGATYTQCIKPNLTWSQFDKIEFDGFRDEWDSYTGTNGIMLLASWTSTDGRASPYIAFRDPIKFSGVSGAISTDYTKAQLRDGAFHDFTITLTSHSDSGQVEFGSWSDAGYGSTWRTKEQRWYNGSTLLRQLVPCYRKSDSVIGMYDLENGVFYTNAGGGTLTKGANV